MFINELPEECLLIIFGSINELDDLLNCYKVCRKWSHLIAERTRKVKYLTVVIIVNKFTLKQFIFSEHEGDWPDRKPFPSYPLNHVYYRTEEPIDGTCLSTLFPNLIIKPLKGLIHQFVYGDSIFEYFVELEMLSYDCIGAFIGQTCANIKQLKIKDFTVSDSFSDYEHGCQDGPYGGPIFRRLKILELFFTCYADTSINYGFQFMDSCPNLQSAHVYFESNRIYVDESIKHKSLQDLVIEFYEPYWKENINWNELERLFTKYPNLKHLALWSYKSLENEYVERFVRVLPNLVLLAVRGCPKVNKNAVNYVQDYNRRHGRAIKFYFDENQHEIQSDWPQLSSKREKISQGFDFMKHCFLKDFNSLPTFLVPGED
uniref:F-box domain-containing protein n=1 Tax=Tetranychus urticae TaxID=32264 RepID=T1KXF5_TETUR